MINKKSSFNSDVKMELNERKLTAYPTNHSKGFAIFYDISMDKFKEEILSMEIKRDRKTQSNHIILLEKMNEKILELNIQALDVVNDTLHGVFHSYNRTVKVYGDYNLQTSGGFVEAIFKYRDRTTHTVITNVDTNIYVVCGWLRDIWPLKSHGDYREFCVTINDRMVQETQSFDEFGVNCKVIYNVSEKCYITPITEDNVPIILPWNANVGIMLKRLSEVLGVDVCTLTLLDNDRQAIDSDSQANIANMKMLFYEIIGTKFRCRSLRETQYIVDVSLIGDRNVAEIKKRLAFKLEVEERRIMVCRGNNSLRNNEAVSVDDELSYYVGLSPSIILTKDYIGQGRFSKVYKCTTESITSTFVLKESSGADLETTEMIILITLASHANIVSYLDLFIDDTNIGIAMEYVERGSLHHYLSTHGPLEEKIIRELSKGILLGLQHLHRNKIMHRDIKGSNVLLVAQFVAKLCDFGLSKLLKNYGTDDLSRGIDRTCNRGSIRWMAPEMIKGEKYGLKIDVWSLGATVIEMITGKLPNVTLNDYQACVFVGTDERIEYDPDTLSDPLKQFVGSCLVADPAARPNVQRLLSLPFFEDEAQSGDSMH